MTPPRLMGVSVVAIAAIALATSLHAQSPVSLRPGLYERTLQTDAGGATGKHTDTLCISPQEAKDIVKTIATAGAETNCKVSDVKTGTAGKLTFKMTCKDEGGTSTYDNEVTYGPDSYTNVSKGKTKKGNVSSKVDAKRVGDCPK